MLEALEEVTQCLGYPDGDETDDFDVLIRLETRQKIAEAIAKARGEA